MPFLFIGLHQNQLQLVWRGMWDGGEGGRQTNLVGYPPPPSLKVLRTKQLVWFLLEKVGLSQAGVDLTSKIWRDLNGVASLKAVDTSLSLR